MCESKSKHRGMEMSDHAIESPFGDAYKLERRLKSGSGLGESPHWSDLMCKPALDRPLVHRDDDFGGENLNGAEKETQSLGHNLSGKAEADQMMKS